VVDEFDLLIFFTPFQEVLYTYLIVGIIHAFKFADDYKLDRNFQMNEAGKHLIY
jgi:hypothetical protein